jgi:nicotinamide-nucleotide amidase
MQCWIISIGDELLIGDTINTNASWMAQLLSEHGVEVERIVTLKDDLPVLKEVMGEALSSADLVISTGGLGPTHDDVTKKAVTDLFNTELIVHEPTLSFIKKTFKKRNIPFSKSNYLQAKVPADCEVLFNEQGTAPGLWLEKKDSILVVLPGVPYEMKHLLKQKALPKIQKLLNGNGVRIARYFLTSGIGESTLSDEVIGDLSSYFNEKISVAFLPSTQGTRIRIRARGSSEQDVGKNIEPVIGHLKKSAGKYIVGEGKDLQLAEAVGELLAEHKLTMATAESCTGGLLGSTVTDIPGSSRYMEGGIIAYANKVKVMELGVSEKDLQKYGAVSKAVALQMAEGVARKMGTDIGISTTGIAGPEGGTREKPVGTVWIGFWNQHQHFAIKGQFTKDRWMNKERSVFVALEMVRRTILNIPEMPYGLQKQTV